jgi:Fe2+ or Zn2+ uptake regulation protein
MSVGFTARKVDPVQDLRVAYQNLNQIQQKIHAIRQCMKTNNFRQMDAELVDAWLNSVEAKQQIEAVGNELKSRGLTRAATGAENVDLPK